MPAQGAEFPQPRAAEALAADLVERLLQVRELVQAPGLDGDGTGADRVSDLDVGGAAGGDDGEVQGAKEGEGARVGAGGDRLGSAGAFLVGRVKLLERLGSGERRAVIGRGDRLSDGVVEQPGVAEEGD